jgi:COP9 signalosome complex subunit 4
MEAAQQAETDINTKLYHAERSQHPQPEVLSDVVSSFFMHPFGSYSIRTFFQRVIPLLLVPDFPVERRLDIGSKLLEKLSSSQASQEEQITELRMLLADAYEASDDYTAAAQQLAAIPLDSSQRKITSEEKAAILIRIVRLHLECDDPTSAESYLNKFKNIMHEVTDRTSLIHFQLSQARIQDSRRDFLAAAKGYQDISLDPSISEDEQLHTLAMATKCAVLAPAGPARSRVLKRLYSDERAAHLDEFAILENMYLERVIAPVEIEKFAQGLAPHQLARMSDGLTVLSKATFEHNLLAASRLYANIGFGSLADLLGVDKERAEEMTARMIEQGRLVGRIDQIEEIIWFEKGEGSGVGSKRREGTVGGSLRMWDANVEGLAEGVEAVMGTLQTKYPVSRSFCLYCHGKRFTNGDIGFCGQTPRCLSWTLGIYDETTAFSVNRRQEDHQKAKHLGVNNGVWSIRKPFSVSTSK